MSGSASNLTFAIPFLDNYSRMAQALANSIRYYHPASDIVALTTAPAGQRVLDVARRCFDDLIEFDDPGFDSAGYTAVVWTRLHLWDLTTSNPVICLDADMQMYRAVPDELVETWQASGCVFGSFLDGMPRTEQHFVPNYAPVAAWGAAPAACVAFLILQPRAGVTNCLIDLAESHHRHVVCPEQAILNLYAAMHGGWLDQSAATVTQSWSPAVLHDPPRTPFVHFGSPRPAFFGPSPLRQGDVDYTTALRKFERFTGQSFPVERFRREFELRLKGTLTKEVANDGID